MNRQSRSRRSTGFDPYRAGAALADLTAQAVQPAAELALLVNDPIYWGWGVRAGDGHAVLVLPGLLGGDRYLEPLRGWLGRIGYRPLRSGIERNPGWSEELVQELGEIAEREYDRSGRRVTIIGHSMGGVLGRSVAMRRPQVIDHVITMGSPLMMSRGRLPETVRFTALYSKEDRIVRHPGGMMRDPRAKNIEVRGSHVGLAFNPAVYRELIALLPTEDVIAAVH